MAERVYNLKIKKSFIVKIKNAWQIGFHYLRLYKENITKWNIANMKAKIHAGRLGS